MFARVAPLFSSRYLHYILLAAIVIAAIFVRVPLVHYPVTNGETQRDFIVGTHILQGEFVSTGAVSGLFGPLRNSPFYYYFLAGILSLHQDFFFMQWANLALQVASILLLYLTGRKLFGKETALIAAALYAFHARSLAQVVFTEHLTFVTPFAALAFYLFALYYKDRSFPALLGGIATLFMAAAVSSTAYAAVLIAGPLTAFLLYRRQATLQHWLYAGGVSVGTFLALNATSMYYHATQGFDAFAIFASRLVPDGATLLGNVSFVVDLFARMFLQSPIGEVVVLREVALIAFAVLILAYLFSCGAGASERKGVMLVLLLFSLMPGALLVLFVEPIFDHYFNFVLGLMCLFLAELIGNIMRTWRAPGAFFAVVLTIVMVVISLVGFDVRVPDTESYPKVLETVVPALAREARALKEEYGYSDYAFFDMRSFSKNSDVDYLIFMMPLEELLGERLFTLSNDAGANVLPRSIGKAPHLFLICNGYFMGAAFDEEADCFQPFTERYPDFVLHDEALFSYHPYTVYRADAYPPKPL
jgi:4-amino-4-deoxy-L-arabinose transferase-like glycosyltransferase